MYAAKRFSCGPGAERRDPTKQFYINIFFYDPVVLGLTICAVKSRHHRGRLRIAKFLSEKLLYNLSGLIYADIVQVGGDVEIVPFQGRF